MSKLVCIALVSLGLSAVLTEAVAVDSRSSQLEKRQSCRPLHQQCGGSAYTGTTCCVSGSSCVFVSSWYSQCRQVAASPSPSPKTSPSPMVSPGTDACNWRDDFTSSTIDTNRWNLNNCAELISVKNGQLVLDVDQRCNKDGHGGRIRTTKKYSKFDVTWSIKTSAAQGGIVNAFYTASTGENVNGAQDEIDFEYLMGASSRRMQTNIYINGMGGRENLLNVAFDPSQAFHKYRLVWDGNTIQWYIDDTLIRTGNGIKQAQYIIMSHWMCDTSVGAFCREWAGNANWNGTPLSMYIDYVEVKGTCS